MYVLRKLYPIASFLFIYEEAYVILNVPKTTRPGTSPGAWVGGSYVFVDGIILFDSLKKYAVDETTSIDEFGSLATITSRDPREHGLFIKAFHCALEKTRGR